MRPPAICTREEKSEGVKEKITGYIDKSLFLIQAFQTLIKHKDFVLREVKMWLSSADHAQSLCQVVWRFPKAFTVMHFRKFFGHCSLGLCTPK